MRHIKGTIPVFIVNAGADKSVECESIRPSENSRFAVTRFVGGKHWKITHIKSGIGCDSVIPARSKSITMTEKLAIVAAWEAHTETDWSAFDALPFGGFNGGFNQSPAKSTQEMMRAEATRIVLGV